jgi:DNA invertase Pin-like site-specific DNA recombinase
MRVAFYLRCSTAEQNVDLQRDALRSLCERHPDWNVSEYVDAGLSGSKDQRPALTALMTACRRGEIDTHILPSPDVQMCFHEGSLD